MKPLLSAALVLFLTLQGEAASFNQDKLSNSQSLNSTATDGTIQGTARRTSRRRTRHTRKRSKSMQKAASPETPVNGPVLDGPNRMEIDPGDIPPADRPRDPNVDDRTKIPGHISPDDMTPPPKPKKKRP